MTKLEAIAQFASIIDDELSGHTNFLEDDNYTTEVTEGHMKTVIACVAAIDALSNPYGPRFGRQSSVLTNSEILGELDYRREYSKAYHDVWSDVDEELDPYALDMQAIDMALEVMKEAM